VPELSLETIADRPWLRVGVQTKINDPHADTEVHAIKVINLKTNRVPTPIQLTGVSIDKLNRADFFRWEQPGIIGVDRDSLPELTTLHVQSRVVDVRKLENKDYSEIFSKPQYRQVDDGESSLRVRRLARRLTFGKQRGWQQIDAIMNHLRQDYTLDDDARAAGNTGHTVEEFLFETKRGPDYLFATSAVWLLRSLDYPARFVSGFYASPDRYDVRSGLTPILSEDVHCWAEVLVQRDNWVTLEPTPGYRVLAPPLSLIERMAKITGLIYTRMLRHPLHTGGLFFVSTMCLLFRRRIMDVVDVSFLRLRAFWNKSWHTLHTMRTIDRRCQRVGLRRPKGMSPRRWLQVLADQINIQRGSPHSQKKASHAATEPFLHRVDCDLYDPANKQLTQQSLQPICNAALAVWSWSNLVAIDRRSAHTTKPHSSFQQPHHERV
ncbi:MAG: transglutaminase domain-containing protein, partial [Planctomycetaceae bacterium]|nr:transglutaminase domain-containing protein [Planctomycetaceae bacterium]